MKAAKAKDVARFVDIPNIGPSMANDFKRLGLKNSQELTEKDPLTLYKKLCTMTHVRQDPCVLDTFMAAVDFMNGASARPWWYYTTKRKRIFPNI
ncbi:helix-hairpin-helix domain-containing protein [Patescibacteria group bacterium]|nr:helix-hairpin-helix domain-containing protein [Patescibacteria group bacterium]